MNKIKTFISLGLAIVGLFLSGCDDLSSTPIYTEVAQQDNAKFNVYGNQTLIYSGDNISEAYDILTYADGNYTFKLAENYQYLFTSMPEANSITVEGDFSPYSTLKDYYAPNLLSISLDSNFILNSNLTFINCDITINDKINLNNYTLTCSQKSKLSNGTIENGNVSFIADGNTASTIVCKADLVNVNLELFNGTIQLYGKSLIADTVSINDRATVYFEENFNIFTINNLVGDQANIRFRKFNCQTAIIKNIETLNLRLFYEYVGTDIPFFTVLSEIKYRTAIVFYLYGVNTMTVQNDDFSIIETDQYSIGGLSGLKPIKWTGLTKENISEIWVEDYPIKDGFMLRDLEENEYSIVDNTIIFN